MHKRTFKMKEKETERRKGEEKKTFYWSKPKGYDWETYFWLYFSTKLTYQSQIFWNKPKAS